MVWGMGERERSGLKSAQPSAARFFLRTPPPPSPHVFSLGVESISSAAIRPTPTSGTYAGRYQRSEHAWAWMSCTPDDRRTRGAHFFLAPPSRAFLSLLALSVSPVKVLGPAQCDQAVGRSQLGKDADLIGVFKLAPGGHDDPPKKERACRKKKEWHLDSARCSLLLSAVYGPV